MTIAVDWEVKQQNKQTKSRAHRLELTNLVGFLSFKTAFILANILHPDEIHSLASDLGLTLLVDKLVFRFLIKRVL